MKKTILTSLIGLAFTPLTITAETIDVDDVTVKANRFERKDTETTYASEIHTRQQIEASGASTLYDYLTQQSSLNLGSSFGNKATPTINLRGYGNENGYQNVVITIDGQRLNNIDSVPQLLAGIPLNNIERIEITKGSGSVIYGDGATAGTVQIYTKAKTGISASASLGNFGQQNHYFSAGISEQHIDLSVNSTHDSHNGYSNRDQTGNRDTFKSNTQNVKLKIKPTAYLRFMLDGTSSRNDTRYVNALTKAEFNENPRQVTQRPFNQTYTHQGLDSDRWQIGTEYDVTEAVSLKASYYKEDKVSEFVNFNTLSDYSYQGSEVTANYLGESLSVILGFQQFDGERKATDNVTTKDNHAFFINSELKADWLSENLILSIGVRQEKVSYAYNPDAGASLKQSDKLSAWDVGVNYRFSNNLSVFTNYNTSFQAPDIDRFFVQDFSLFPVITTSFNGFINPQRAKTFNVGLNYVTKTNALKLTAFHTALNDEIYLDSTLGFFGTNSNLDKTKKYGLEIQDNFKINNQLSASLKYNYVRSLVQNEDTIAGAPIKNKDLPGVPKHSFVGNLNYSFSNGINLNLNHVWRSTAYALNDFQNNLEQKQDKYQTTNLAINYKHKRYTFFAAVNNIFEEENSIQVRDDGIYPVDFVRTWRIGAKVDF